MKLILTTALCLAASMASATEKECPKQGGGYMCPGNIYIDGSKASSSAEALAIATAKAEQSQGQQQGQVQGQVAEGGNAYNGGNSVSISNPKHTTSIGLGLNVGVTVPVGQNYVQGRHESAANWYMLHGDSCTAFKVMDKSPAARTLRIKRNCGDKG